MFKTFAPLARLRARTFASTNPAPTKLRSATPRSATLAPTCFATLLAATWLAAAALATSPAAAQTWPDRPIRIIIPFAPGGGADGVARLLAVQLEKDLGQPVVVESKAGGNTVIAAQTVARAAPDGYTLLMTGGSTMSLLPLTASTPLPYDPFKDFSPIGMLSKGPYLVAVSSSLGADTLADVLTLARTRPGAVAYASNGIGASAHIGMELLAQRAGVQMTHVPYKGFAPALGDVVSGRTPLTMIDLATLGGFAKSGRIKILASTAAQRSPMFPEVPTVAELGYPGYEVETWFALYAPARTPSSVVAKVGELSAKWLATPEAKAALAALGQEATASSPDAVTQRILAEQKAYAPLVTAANIKTD